jgi:hypothetical protein
MIVTAPPRNPSRVVASSGRFIVPDQPDRHCQQAADGWHQLFQDFPAWEACSSGTITRRSNADAPFRGRHESSATTG